MRVAMVLGNDAEAAVTFLSIASTATCVPLDPGLTEFELRTLLPLLRVVMVVTSGEHAAAGAAARALGLPLWLVTSHRRAAAGCMTLSESARGHGPTARNSPDHALVLPTSGSTGIPKVVPLTPANLLASTDHVARSLGLTSQDVALSALPLFHIGGLVDLLLAPLSVGGSVVFADDKTPSSFFAHLREERPSWYQAVPAMLQAILRHTDHLPIDLRGTSLRFVRSVSAPLPRAVLEEFERRFGVPVIEIYGMTETAGVLTSNPMPPGERRPGSVGLPVGCEIEVRDSDGKPLGAGATGEIVVRGPSVMAGYESADGSAAAVGGSSWFGTGDLGYRDADGYVFLTGRLKDIVNRGGEKIAPREVDEAALLHPGLRAAAAFAMPHPSLGEELALAAVRAEGATVDAAELTAWLEERLAAFKVPRRIWFVDQLPHTPSGKVQRFLLSKQFAGAATPEPHVAPDREPDDRERLLIELWQRVLGVRPRLHDDFFDLGGDSLKAAEFLRELSERLGCEVQAAALYDHSTIATLAARLPDFPPRRQSSDGAAADRAVLDEVRAFLASWGDERPPNTSLLVGRHRNGKKPPFFWCGQGYSEFTVVADRTDADLPIYGLRSLWEARCKSRENERRLARHYADEIQVVWPEGPIRLGGYCAGARIMVDVARVLRTAGRDVETLCLLEYVDPSGYDGRVALLFGVHGPQNPLADPREPWRTRHPGDVRVYPLPGHHTNVLHGPDLVAALHAELNGAPPPEPTPRTGFVTISARPPRWMFGMEKVAVTVDVHNRSPWPCAPGTVLAARWLRGDARCLWQDAQLSLAEGLAPGARTRLRLEITAPGRPAIWTLDFHLVEAGDDARRRAHHNLPLRRRVAILPGRAAFRHVFGLITKRTP